MKVIKMLMRIEQIFSAWHQRVRNRIVSAGLGSAEFIPFIQPIYKSRAIVGGEVLMRVKKGGILHSPENYISVIESGNVIDDVTCELLRSVKSHFSAYRESLPAGFYFSFNICAMQLNSPRVIDAIKDFNAHFKNDVAVVLEIVERGTIDLDDFALETMQELTEAGVRFAIDDFGSGSSCLKYIEHAGFSTIKIDKCLTVSCSGTLIYSTVIDAIVSLSRKLNIQVIAEGIENEEQYRLLKNKGVNTFQGYLFSKPVSMYEFAKRI